MIAKSADFGKIRRFGVELISESTKTAFWLKIHRFRPEICGFGADFGSESLKQQNLQNLQTSAKNPWIFGGF